MELGRLKDMENQNVIVSCKDNVKTTFFNLFIEHKHKHDIIVHIHPALIFNNGLPTNAKLQFLDDAKTKSIIPVSAGECDHINTVDTSRTPLLFGFDLTYYGRSKAISIRHFSNNVITLFFLFHILLIL